MNKRFSIGVFQCFTHKQVKEINKKIKENILQKQDPSDASSTASKVGEFFNVPCLPLMELLHPWLYQCQQANRDVYGYDINWDFHLETFNYNVYGVEGGYTWHIDANPTQTPTDTKLTCLLNLSEETYEGGEFYAIHSNEKVQFDSGMGLIITSLIAHRVAPVTKGERITLAYFSKGPLWR